MVCARIKERNINLESRLTDMIFMNRINRTAEELRLVSQRNRAWMLQWVMLKKHQRKRGTAPEAGSFSLGFLPQLWTYQGLLAMPPYLVVPQLILFLNVDLLNSHDYY